MTEPKISRRWFLGGAAAAGASLVVPQILLPEEEPVRRFWQVSVTSPFGRPLMVPGFLKDELEPISDLDLDGPVQGGLIPIKGQPGLFRDAATGQIVNIRDFRESDKYDTEVIIGADDAQKAPGSEFVFFRDIPPVMPKSIENVQAGEFKAKINAILEDEDDEIIKFPGGLG